MPLVMEGSMNRTHVFGMVVVALMAGCGGSGEESQPMLDQGKTDEAAGVGSLHDDDRVAVAQLELFANDKALEELASRARELRLAEDSARELPPVPIELRQPKAECGLGGNGSYNFCTVSCPCDAGEGDCDSNEECSAGTYCAWDVGPDYGMQEGTDVCVPFPGCHGAAPGAYNFCSAACPCGDGEGDCDNDNECVPNSYCAQDVGPDYGFPEGTDVCVAFPGCHAGPDGAYNFCSADCPCEEGEGDCDEDYECGAGMYCALDVGADYGYVDGTDVCLPFPGCHQAIPGRYNFCTAGCPCNEGEGDCDEDYECATGLYCAADVGPDYGFVEGTDVCLPFPGCHMALPGRHNFCTAECPCNEGEGDCDEDYECVAGTYCSFEVGPDYGFAEGIDVCVPFPGCHTAAPGRYNFCTVECPCAEGEGDCDSDAECQPGLSCPELEGTDYCVAGSECTGAQVVISQIYPAGGMSGSTYRHDFVELHNRSLKPVSVQGWSVQAASANGSFGIVVPLTGSIPAGGYYLVAMATGSTNGQVLPTPDVTQNYADMDEKKGKVALVASTTPLQAKCPTGAIDLVGYGATNCSEGSTAPAAQNNRSIVRAGTGCTDSNNNGADFATSTPAPRNSSTAAFLCLCP